MISICGKKVPIYETGAFFLGFTAGYLESKGIEIPTRDSIGLIYAPTAIAIGWTASALKLMHIQNNVLTKFGKERILNGELRHKYPGENNVALNDMTLEERTRVMPILEKAIENMENSTKNLKILEPTAYAGSKTLTISLTGYVIGGFAGKYL